MLDACCCEQHGLKEYTVDHAQVLVVIGHSIDRIAGHRIQMSKAQTFVLPTETNIFAAERIS